MIPMSEFTPDLRPAPAPTSGPVGDAGSGVRPASR